MEILESFEAEDADVANFRLQLAADREAGVGSAGSDRSESEWVMNDECNSLCGSGSCCGE